MNQKGNSWDNDFKINALYRLDESMRMIEKSLRYADDRDIWKTPNPSSNSIGNLILHLCGNITQYVISSLGHSEDSRDRDLEFSTKGGLTKEELLDKLRKVITQAKKVITETGEDELMRVRDVQGFNLSGIGIVVHVVEHLSYHTGQIAFWIKLLKDKDLGFYDGIDLNIKNDG